jgi:hypothetical protein
VGVETVERVLSYRRKAFEREEELTRDALEWEEQGGGETGLSCEHESK